LEGRFIDVKYHELISDPMAIVRQIYRRLDLRLDGEGAEGMQRLASRRSRYKDGVMDSTWRISNLMEHSIVIDWKLYCFPDSNFLLVSGSELILLAAIWLSRN